VYIVLPEYVIRDILTEDMIDEVCLPSQVIAELLNNSFNEGNVFEYHLYILIKKTYQFINVVNGVSHSHKTANIFFHLT